MIAVDDTDMGLLRLSGPVLFGPHQRHQCRAVFAGYGDHKLLRTDVRMADDPVFMQLVAEVTSVLAAAR